MVFRRRERIASPLTKLLLRESCLPRAYEFVAVGEGPCPRFATDGKRETAFPKVNPGAGGRENLLRWSFDTTSGYLLARMPGIGPTFFRIQPESQSGKLSLLIPVYFEMTSPASSSGISK